jgi:hypothetical protein
MSISIACASEDVKVIKKGDIAPFDGVIFTREVERSIREELEFNKVKIDKLTKLNMLNEQELEVISKRLELNQKISRELADREVKIENNSFLKNTLYFLSGALITGIIAHGVNR